MKKIFNEARVLFITGGIVLALCFLWMLLEYVAYGSVTARVVDDLMMAIMIPFVYCTILYFETKKDKNKGAS